jgi:hypothetical protein
MPRERIQRIGLQLVVPYMIQNICGKRQMPHHTHVETDYQAGDIPPKTTPLIWNVHLLVEKEAVQQAQLGSSTH